MSALTITPCALRTSGSPVTDTVRTSTPPRRSTSTTAKASMSSKPSAKKR